MKVLKFGAVWCSGCLVMRPRWQEIETEMPELKTEYYDFDKDKQKVKEFKISDGKLPVFVFVDKKGKELVRVSGERGKEELVELIGKHKDK